MRVAIVHDWLTNLGGAERVVAAMLEAYPKADLYTSVYNPDRLSLFDDYDVRTTFLQHIPLAKKKHQLFSALRRLAFEGIDLSDYDVVISSSTAEAKGIITSERTKHIAYINTPTRYLWSHFDDYLAEPGFGALDPLARWQLRRTVAGARRWDFAAAQRPDMILANSQNVQDRIEKYYKRDSTVLYPVVDVERFRKSHPRPTGMNRPYLVVISRLVPYKRVDLAVQAAKELQYPLVVICTGPELNRLRTVAGPDTVFLNEAPDEEVVQYMQHAEAFLFPGEEDFGITPVEAMASGVPVIAYGRGGASETVDDASGIHVPRQTIQAFVRAIQQLDKKQFDPAYLRARAQSFAKDRFIRELREAVRVAVDGSN